MAGVVDNADPNPTIAFLDKEVIGLGDKVGTSSLPDHNSGLKNLPTDGSVLNTALLMVNFISSY